VSSVHNLHRLWFVELDAPSESAPVVASGNVFVTTREGTTYAVNTRTGSVRWKFVTHGPGITTAMPAADPATHVLYVPGTDGYIHKLDASDGSERKDSGFPARITLTPKVEKDASAFNLAGGYLYAVTSGYLGD